MIPPINAYGTFAPPALHHRESSASFASSVSSEGHERRPLLPAQARAGDAQRGVLGSVSADLVPFEGIWRSVGRIMGIRKKVVVVAEGDVEAQGVAEARGDSEGGIQRRWRGDVTEGDVAIDSTDAQRIAGNDGPGHGRGGHAMAGLENAGTRLGVSHAKHRPRVAGGGENLPLEILQSLSIWLSILDSRGVVPGAFLRSS